VRKILPQGAGLSITALLDWFHDSGAAVPVMREVDEFVPQFYDTKPLTGDNPAVAAKIDAARWAPAFNRFGKPYRVAISTFGRARRLHFTPESPKGEVLAVYSNETRADFAGKPWLHLDVSHNDAGELVLSYRVVGRFPHANRLPVGDVFQFIVPQPASVRMAFESVRKMGGYCAGVLFFRWPSPYESDTLDPDEVFAAIGLSAAAPPAPAVQMADAGCAAVTCSDLYLLNGRPLQPNPVRFLVSSSQSIEYFLPKEGVPARLLDSNHLELRLSAYGGRRAMYIGRVVTASAARFTVGTAQ